MKEVFFLKSHEVTSASSKLFNRFLTSLILHRTGNHWSLPLDNVSAYRNIVAGLIFSLAHWNYLYISIRLFCFLILHVFTGVALKISFKNFSSVFTTWLPVWYNSLRFYPVLAFNMPSSLSIIISHFWSKVRDMRLFLSLWGHFRAVNWSNFNIVVSQRVGRLEERERDGWTAGQCNSQNTFINQALHLIWV